MAAGDSKAPAKNRGDVVDEVAALSSMTQGDVDKVIKAYEKSIVEALSSGGDVRLAGFGTFKTTQRAARTARNPQTGAPVQVPARTSPRFVPGKTFKAMVEGQGGGATKAAKSAKPATGAGKSVAAKADAKAKPAAAKAAPKAAAAAAPKADAKKAPSKAAAAKGGAAKAKKK